MINTLSAGLIIMGSKKIGKAVKTVFEYSTADKEDF